ncbi:uncharacterized protein LOC141657060 isoform X1 [Silene latifolia]|uniref:uncharacterized protein LOC141657060 isoform X1 n=1 Tax=Silene latifolia TaxID=37657 RepID=UPI003D789926
MKITSNKDLTTKPTPSDLLPKIPLPRRKLTKTTPRSSRHPRSSAAGGGGPVTPLLKWNFKTAAVKTTASTSTASASAAANNVAEEDKLRKSRRERNGGGGVSARGLAAALWRMQTEALAAAEAENGGGGEGGERRRRWRRESGEGGGKGGGEGGEGGGDRLGYKVCLNYLFESQDLNLLLLFSKPGLNHGVEQLSCHHRSRECGSEAKDPPRSPCSVNGPIDQYLCESPFQYANYAMEGATKWDPVDLKPSHENPDNTKLLDQKANAAVISALERELEQARARIEKLEVERRSSKKKVEHFLKKLSEERAAWRSREHEKVRAIIDDIKCDLNRERKNRQRLEIVNSKLVNELTEVKLSAKRYMQDYEKERKARVLIEEVCDELAKEIGEDKAEVDSLKKECMKIQEEVEDERKMLQMAEVWREERVQMKLVDAKVALDQKYSQMNYLVEKLENLLKSKGVALDANELREAELLHRAAKSMNVQDIKEFKYEPSNPDDIFAVVEEMAMAEINEREIEPCVDDYSPSSHASHASKVRAVSPEINSQRKDIHRLSNMYAHPSGDMDDDGSGWETVSQADDRGSCYSPEGSLMSVNRMCRDSNASGSCTEWEERAGDETPITEISEVCSVPSKPQRKVKSISRLWRSGHNNGDNCKIISVDGVKGRLSNGRVSSNGATMSPDRGSGKGGIDSLDMVGWSSPETGNPNINRGMKGCIEWPRGAQKNSLKNKLLEARMESQKIQLRQVLKQKI